MDSIENIIGYFGQMTLPLAKKTAIYILVFAFVAFLQGFITTLPETADLLNSASLLIAVKAGFAFIYSQILLVVTPGIISIANPYKK